MDSCAQGHSVELKADRAHNAFLSGPLDLEAGVPLRIDSNTIDYEVWPGSCGIVNDAGRGCRALINGEGVA